MRAQRTINHNTQESERCIEVISVNFHHWISLASPTDHSVCHFFSYLFSLYFLWFGSCAFSHQRKPLRQAQSTIGNASQWHSNKSTTIKTYWLQWRRVPKSTRRHSTMTSVFFQGKYRQRKDWSTSSIPELVSLEEEGSHGLPEIPTTLPPKAPRRSSLAIGLLAGGRGLADPKSKRRSSIATAFLGRQNKVTQRFSVDFDLIHFMIWFTYRCVIFRFPCAFVGTQQNKDASYETAVASEKRDSREQNSHNDNDNNGTPKFCDFADDDLMGDGSDENEQTQSPMSSSPPVVVGSPRHSLFTSTPEKDKRRRSSTWHTKIERRRRKNSSNPSIGSSVIDDSDIDDLNGNSINEVADSPPNEYGRQKRHSWWNIFVPDNIKQRYPLQLHPSPPLTSINYIHKLTDKQITYQAKPNWFSIFNLIKS